MRTVALALLGLLLGTTSACTEPPWADNLFKNGTTHDFADGPGETLLQHTFKLYNIYAVPLDINARSGCGCLTVRHTNQTLKPKEEGQIDIILDGRRFLGRKSVNVFITVSAPNYISSTTLQISANRRTDVVFSPGQVSLGVVPQGQRSTPQFVDVEYVGTLDWRVTHVIEDSAILDVTYKELNRKRGYAGYQLMVSVRPDAPAGFIKHELYLKTNNPESPLVPILVEGTVQASLSVAPNPISFGSLKVGDSVNRVVVMRGSKPFRVVSAEADEDGLSAELPAAAKEVHVIKLKYQPARSGDLHRQLKIKTDLVEEPAVTLNVEGTVSQ